MRLSLTLLYLLFALVCVQQASGLFFYLKEGSSKCFLEDLPKDTVVIVQVEAEDISANAAIPGYPEGEFQRRKKADTEPIQIVGEITFGKQVIAGNTIGANGRFAFTSQEPGEHKICLKAGSSAAWFGSGALKMSVDLQIGESNTNDYDEIKALEMLTDLEVYVRKLNDRVVDIRKEQAYFKYREESMRDNSELANSNVMWFSFIQTFILVASGVWQIFHLKSFFKAKKMV